jgi:hypothetical protein
MAYTSNPAAPAGRSNTTVAATRGLTGSCPDA